MNKTIHELNSLAQAQADDELIIYDVSEGESKKIQVQALNNPNYSTEETLTGGKWIDGKPIYRKCLTITNLIQETNISVASLGIDSLIRINGTFEDADNKVVIGNLYYDIYKFVGIYYRKSDNVIRIERSTDLSGTNTTVIVLEYTKTTD